jgi:hypothetical protein
MLAALRDFLGNQHGGSEAKRRDGKKEATFAVSQGISEKQ